MKNVNRVFPTEEPATIGFKEIIMQNTIQCV